MARSLYKGERLGNRPPCLLCMGRGEGERAELHLPYGVSVWLCAAHRSNDFRTRRAGRDFVASLSRAWAAAGCMTRARHRALDAHLAGLRAAPAPRDRPASYSWPALRRDAERRFAAGEPPRRVMEDVRAQAAAGPAVPPSPRTLRRWFRERRWDDDGSGVERRDDPVRPLGDLVAAPARAGRSGRAGGEWRVGALALVLGELPVAVGRVDAPGSCA